MFDFQKFSVYILANKTYKNLIPIYTNKKINAGLRDQLKRACSSIILNIAEGAGKFSKLDKKNFYTIARGSANECVAILDILKLEGNINEECYQKLYNNFLEINKMLSGLIRTMVK